MLDWLEAQIVRLIELTERVAVALENIAQVQLAYDAAHGGLALHHADVLTIDKQFPLCRTIPTSRNNNPAKRKLGYESSNHTQVAFGGRHSWIDDGSLDKKLVTLGFTDTSDQTAKNRTMKDHTDFGTSNIRSLASFAVNAGGHVDQGKAVRVVGHMKEKDTSSMYDQRAIHFSFGRVGDLGVTEKGNSYDNYGIGATNVGANIGALQVLSVFDTDERKKMGLKTSVNTGGVVGGDAAKADMNAAAASENRNKAGAKHVFETNRQKGVKMVDSDKDKLRILRRQSRKLNKAWNVKHDLGEHGSVSELYDHATAVNDIGTKVSAAKKKLKVDQYLYTKLAQTELDDANEALRKARSARRDLGSKDKRTQKAVDALSAARVKKRNAHGFMDNRKADWAVHEAKEDLESLQGKGLLGGVTGGGISGSTHLTDVANADVAVHFALSAVEDAKKKAASTNLAQAAMRKEDAANLSIQRQIADAAIRSRSKGASYAAAQNNALDNLKDNADDKKLKDSQDHVQHNADVAADTSIGVYAADMAWAKAQAEAKANVKAKADAGAKVDAGAKAVVEAKADPGAKAKADAESKAKADARAKIDSAVTALGTALTKRLGSVVEGVENAAEVWRQAEADIEAGKHGKEWAKTDDVTQVPLHHAPAADKVIHTMLSTAHEHMETEGAG